MNTGNPIVDVIGMLDCSGLVIPASWHFTITRDSGRPHYPAIALLAEIVSWYMPKPIYNDKGYVVDYQAQFDGDFLCRSYEKLSNSLNMSKQQAQRALTYLEQRGIVKRHFYEEYIEEVRYSTPNHLAIELIPEGLLAVTRIYDDTLEET
ncbi:MAG: hypothetical protein ACOX4A_00025 [Saccharofermentanales bacterium]|jgi:DNA-binding transcriptional ArsR family regulator